MRYLISATALLMLAVLLSGCLAAAVVGTGGYVYETHESNKERSQSQGQQSGE